LDLDLDADQLAVQELFAGFFANECSSSLVRSSETLGFSPGLWERLRALDVDTLAREGELLDSVLAAEQAGRCLAPVPLVEHVVAVRVLGRLGEPTPPSPRPLTIALRPDRELARLVPAGAVAGAFLVLVGEELLLVRDDPPDVAVANGSGLPLADRAIADPYRLAGGDRAVAHFRRALDEWRLVVAAFLVGVADAALALGVGYVGERHQFGVPIGSFQGIQHGLAELVGPLNGARLMVRRAAWRGDHGGGELAVDAAMAFLFGTEVARTTTARVLHYHGGYGAMEEYDIQLYYRRARGVPAQLGDPARELERLACLLYGDWTR
jgi:hypothetical protein